MAQRLSCLFLNLIKQFIKLILDDIDLWTEHKKKSEGWRSLSLLKSTVFIKIYIDLCYFYIQLQLLLHF